MDDPSPRAPGPPGALLRLAARRALGLLALWALFTATLYVEPPQRGDTRPGVGFLLAALTPAAGLAALTLLARPARRAAALALQHLGLGVVGTLVGLTTYAQPWQLHALGGGGDLVASWSAALAAVGRLEEPSNGPDATLLCGATAAAALATALVALAFSGGRQAWGSAALVPLPGLALLTALGHAHGLQLLVFALVATVGTIPFLVLFGVVELAVHPGGGRGRRERRRGRRGADRNRPPGGGWPQPPAPDGPSSATPR